jgi:nitrogen fixation protein NifU and related proteins
MHFGEIRVISWIVLSKPKKQQNRISTVRANHLAYSETFKDHLANPRNAGELSDANAVAEETNPVCGDRLRLSLRIRDGRIETARFLAYGCPPTLACGSVLAEMLEGTTIEDALKLERKEIVAVLGGLSSRKEHAAALAIDVLRAAIEKSHEHFAPDEAKSKPFRD